MNLYHAIETGFIMLIGVLSVYSAVRLLMPRVVAQVHTSIARRLERSPSRSWRRRIANRVRAAVPNAGCGSGNCSSGCSGCNLATQVRSRLAGDDNASH